MFPNFTQDRIAVGDGFINTVRAGSGPPVLLLHGYPQSLALWARVAPVLALDFTVVCADLRGYGDSWKPVCLPDQSNYAFRALAAEQVAVMAALGFERFHLIGHDRGGRVAHRMALDHPNSVLSLAVLDIVPTLDMLTQVDRHLAAAYWHWYFLAQPAPFPETLIGANPDFFFETCLVTWGKARIEDFAPDQLAEYRRCWRDPGMIHGSCSDYRASLTQDIAHDTADQDRTVACPALALWGAGGLMAKLFDMEAVWARRCQSLKTAAMAGGHFFIDQAPEATAHVLLDFLRTQSDGSTRNSLLR